MKHVPNGREERNTTRDGTRAPVKKNSQGWDPRTHERKSSSNGRQVGKFFVLIGCGLIVRAMGKDAPENPMRLVKVETDYFALKRRCSRLKEGFSHTKSLGSQEGEENLQTMMRSSARCRKQSKVFRKRTIKEVIHFTNTTCRTSR